MGGTARLCSGSVVTSSRCSSTAFARSSAVESCSTSATFATSTSHWKSALVETVTVEATPPPLNTSDSTVGTVITNEQIAALPLNGRDYLQLASLSAGTGPASTQGVVIDGQAGTAVAFRLIVKPSVDAIQEFKVVTNSYSAEYGRSSSGVVSVSLKSGTDSLNGCLYRCPGSA